MLVRGLCTKVVGCEIHVVHGRIEDYADTDGAIVALPCNEYFDDVCVADTKSALGAYVTLLFGADAAAFVVLAQEECKKKFGDGIERQKTKHTRAMSFGVGKCLLLTRPLGRSVSVALVSTTTQRAGQGLAGRMSYVFDGIRELVSRLADARFNEVVMPILGANHGGIDAQLAFVALLLALAEAAHYGQGGQHLKKATIVVFRPDANGPGQIDQDFIRRALSLIGMGG